MILKEKPTCLCRMIYIVDGFGFGLCCKYRHFIRKTQQFISTIQKSICTCTHKIIKMEENKLVCHHTFNTISNSIATLIYLIHTRPFSLPQLHYENSHIYDHKNIRQSLTFCFDLSHQRLISKYAFPFTRA